VWLITIRDLQWRQRRFAFGVLGTALVFAITLLMSGLSASLRGEARRAVSATGAHAWVVREGISGPFSGLSALPVEAADAVASTPGVERADPYVVTAHTVTGEGRRPRDVMMFGYRLGGMGPPAPVRGRLPSARGEAVVDRSLGVAPGGSFTLGGSRFRVVGQLAHMTLRAGQPMIFLPLEDAQAIVFKGLPLATTVLVRGPAATAAAPPGLDVLTAAEARSDMLRPFRQALQAIDLVRVLLWFVAVAIIGTLIYLSVLERTQDFAMLKAVGTASATLFASLALQAVIVSVSSALAANALAYLLRPAFPLPITLVGSAALILLAVAVVVGVLASLAGLRRAVGVDPAVAFGSA
jgi:putative ABC transport system permease protein